MSLRRKRLKVAVACIPCRQRKVKCDGARPVCSSCGHNALETCVYPTITNSRSPALQYYTQPSSHRPQIPHSNSAKSSQQSPTVADGGGGDRYYDSSLSDRRTLLAGLEGTPSESLAADSMNGVTDVSAQRGEVFGSSSAGFFMRHLQAAIGASQNSIGSPAGGGDGVSRPQPDDRCGFYDSRYQGASLLLVPPRGQADILMHDYWNYGWSLFPIINRSQIETIYESLWESGTKPEIESPVTVGIITICFALGCHYSKTIPANKRKATGDEFFSQAERLYRWAADHPSLESVQYLLLLGIYLQSTSKVFQCWMVVGQAVRMAQSLGIHLEETSSGSSSWPLALREYRRRTWHACVWLDCVLSATFGRPGMIPKCVLNSASLPLMIDDEFLETQTEGSALRPDGRPCGLAFFVKAVELYQILNDVLSNLYLSPPNSQKFEARLIQILDLDGRLQAWTETLPSHLKASVTGDSEDADESIVKRQAMVLRIRFLHVRTLLFRPAVAEYCTRTTSQSFTSIPPNSCNESLSNAMLFQCTRMCFEFAHELINTFSRHLELRSLSGPLPIWWYSVLYVYTGATIILTQRFLEKDGSSGGTDFGSSSKAKATWDKVLHVLESYSTLAEPARRCLVALETFSKRLSFEPAGGGSKNSSLHHWHNTGTNRDFDNSNDNATHKTGGDINSDDHVLPAPMDPIGAHNWESVPRIPNAFAEDVEMNDHDILSTFLDESLWSNFYANTDSGSTTWNIDEW